MALIFIDSFDHYATADIGLKWSAVVAGSGVTTINATAGRRSGGAIQCGGAASVRKDIPGTQTVITGFALKFAATPTSSDPSSTVNIHWMTLGGSDATHLYFAVAPDGSIAVYRRISGSNYAADFTLLGQTTAGILQPNVYAYVEVKAKMSATTAGSVKILVNGVNALNLQGIRTTSYASTVEQVTRMTLWGLSYTSSTYTWFDDLYIADTSGTLNNDFFGDVRIDVALPNADGTYKDFTPDTGTAHYSRVNEATADQTSYVYSSTVGAKDSYKVPALTGIVGTIRGVQIVDTAIKDDAGTRSISHLVKSGASEAYSGALPLSTDRKLYTTIQETDPATGALWTQTGLANAEFGVVVAA